MPINKQFLKSRPEVKVTFAVERRPRERPSRCCCWESSASGNPSSSSG